MDESQQDKQNLPNEPVIITPQLNGTVKIDHTQPVEPSPEPAKPGTPTAQQEEPKPEPIQPVITEPPLQSEKTIENNQPLQNNWQYNSGQLAPVESTAPQTEEKDAFSWSASDSHGMQKTTGWYLLLIIIAISVSAISFLLTKDIITVVVICIVAVALVFYAKTKPHNLSYSLSPAGLEIGQKHLDFQSFKSFSVLDDNPPSIQLMPQKRFMMPISLYFVPQDGEQITKLLGEFLPYEHREADLLDKITNKLHF